jgi:hypothetical protein
MNSGTQIPKKQTVVILSALSVLILFISLESMIRIKDLQLFRSWYESFEVSKMSISESEAFNVYVTGQLALYFFRIVVPMIFGIHVFVAYVKLRINKLFIFIWSVLLLGSLAYRLVDKDYTSVFFYINSIGYGVVLWNLWSLTPIINGNENR